MATAISVVTESCDRYLYCFEKTLTEGEVQGKLREKLGCEYDFISDYTIAHSEEKDY